MLQVRYAFRFVSLRVAREARRHDTINCTAANGEETSMAGEQREGGGKNKAQAKPKAKADPAKGAAQDPKRPGPQGAAAQPKPIGLQGGATGGPPI